MRALAAVLVASTLLLAACAASGESPSPTATARQDPSDLVRLWRVDTPSETGPTWLRLGEEVTLWDSCGIAQGAWVADDTLFLAQMIGSIEPWCRSDYTFPSWLEQAETWRESSPQHVQLLDSDGKVLASLSIHGAPATITDAPDINQSPRVTERMAAAMRDPVSLPTNARPAVELDGRWNPTDAADDAGYVEFTGDTWTGTDGCNRTTGRFRLGEGSRLLVTTGANGYVACDHMSSAPRWVAEAARAGMVDDDLVFYDAKGKELGSFTRA